MIKELKSVKPYNTKNILIYFNKIINYFVYFLK